MLTPRVMLIFAQSFLILGALGMIPASWKLFNRALDAGMPSWHLYWIIPVALVVGGAKAVFVMRKRMRLNIKRIAGHTGRLWPWQIYPPQLLAFIVTMVVLMNVMKRVLDGHGMGLGLLGGVDVAVFAALLMASGEYRRRRD
jgi:hypothetical protein